MTVAAESEQSRTPHNSADRAERLMRTALRGAAARFGMLPIQQVLAGMEAHGVDLSQVRALEVFGSDGERVTKQYADRVASLDIWEIDAGLEGALRRRFPHAAVKITDSYAEVRRTSERYDFVMIDNAVWAEEHFPLFPGIFRVLADQAAMALLVIPHADRLTSRRYPALFNEDHLARRRAFYRMDSPERMSLTQLATHYSALADHAGLVTDWRFWVNRREVHCAVPRRTSTYYLVLGLHRRGQMRSFG